MATTRLLGTMLIAVVFPASALAQRVSGDVRDGSTRDGIMGAVVLATTDSGAIVARTLSNASGRYGLTLPASATRLRFLRIGYRPVTLAVPDIVSGEGARDVVMERVVTLLAAEQVIEQSHCPAGADNRRASALWQHARTGLLATVVAREAFPAVVVNQTYERVMRPADSLVLQQRTRSTSGRSARAFLTGRSPGDLAASGYSRAGPAGVQYDIPDADVLLDESFAATHCFDIARGAARHPGAVGLSFAPVPGRDSLVDVSGVLWLDQRSAELRSLEFRFTRLHQGALGVSAGGGLTFRTMPNGVVMIDRWRVVLPAVEQSIRAARRTELGVRGQVRSGLGADSVITRVAQWHETGGRLLRATWDAAPPWDAPTGTVAGRVLEQGTDRPLAGVSVALQGTTESVSTGAVGTYSITSLLEGTYVAVVTDTTMSVIAPPRSATMTIAIRDTSAVSVDLRLPTRDDALTRACADPTAARTRADSVKRATVMGRVSLPSQFSSSGLSVSATWQADYVIANATLGGAVIKSSNDQIDLDGEGRFLFCDVARERPVLLRLSRGARRLADTLVMADAPLVLVDWRPRIPGVANALATSTFRGIVRRADGTPLADADVWIANLDVRARTDSSGAFKVEHIPAGPALIQIRHIAYFAQRDTLTLADGEDRRREYTLAAQGTVLDTVRTTAAQSRNLSPALRGFEDRRSLGIGRFIGAAVLRANDDKDLSAVILQHMPGIMFVPGPAGASYLVSTRKTCAGSVLLGSCKPCFVTIYLDGVPLYVASDNNQPPPPDVRRFRNSDLGGAEFYGTSTAPPGLASSSGCGTLLLWTRER